MQPPFPFFLTFNPPNISPFFSSSFIQALPQILLPFTVTFALALHPFKGRGVVGAGLILGVVVGTFISPWPRDVQSRYGMLNSWFYWVPVVQKLLCGVPEREFWRTGKEEEVSGEEKQANGKGEEKEAMRMRALSWKKLVWAAELFANPRGVGWNFRLKSTIARPALYRNDQRCQFMLRNLCHFILRYLVVDAGTNFLGGFDPKSDSSVWSKMATTLGWGVMVRCNWEMMWLFTSLVSVGLRISGPENWPPLFGRWSDCTSVGGFWGRFWQGILRHSLLGLSREMIRVLGIPNRTVWSYFTHLATGFFISGFFHAIVLANLPVNPPIPARALWIQNLLYFLIQIVPIVIENYVATLVEVLETRFEVQKEAEEGKCGRIWRALKMTVGVCWTMAWLLGTGWPYLGTYMSVDMGDWKVPFSVWGWLLGRHSVARLSGEPETYIQWAN